MSVQMEASGTCRVAVGEPVVVRLPENPGTGYQWTVTSAEGLEVGSDEYEAPDSAAPGAGGHRVITVAASRAGTAHLHVERRRVWEPAAVETCDIEVVVDGP